MMTSQKRRTSLATILQDMESSKIDEDEEDDNEQPPHIDRAYSCPTEVSNGHDREVDHNLVTLFREVKKLRDKAERFHRRYEKLQEKYEKVQQENNVLRLDLDKSDCDKRLLQKENERLTEKIRILAKSLFDDSESLKNDLCEETVNV